MMLNMKRTGTAMVYISSQIKMVCTLSTLSFNLKDPSLLTVSTPDYDISKGRGEQQQRQQQDVLLVNNPSASFEEICDGSCTIAKLRSMNRESATKAIQKSGSVLSSWRDQTTASKRSQILHSWSELIKENRDDIAKIMTLESGKPLAESNGEIVYGTSFLDFFAAEAIRPSSAGGGFLVPSPFENLDDGSPRGKIMAVQEAVGVCAMITPWNFPLAMITRKVGPALAAGCSAVLKPSELTPLTAIALQTLAIRAGLPEDIFQLIICNKDDTPAVGEEFCTNPIVKKISFTGSTKVGKHLMKTSSDTVKRLSLELGGNAPFIVFDDANIDQAVQAAIASKFRAAGQTCVCADRFLIHKSIEDEFLSKTKSKVSMIQVGDGLDINTKMGPLISRESANTIKEKIEEALKDGAECVHGGNPTMLADLGPNFLEPTILRNVNPSSRIWHTETFGPVMAIQTFGSEEEAIQLANDTPYGLASYFCSQNMERIFRVANRLECGLVGINEGIISTATAPFGGVKESGLGREGSIVGISEYLETKYMFLNV